MITGGIMDKTVEKEYQNKIKKLKRKNKYSIKK